MALARDEGEIDLDAVMAPSIERINLGPGGAQANNNSIDPAISADGRYVAFVSEATNLVPGEIQVYRDVYIRDLQQHTTIRISQSLTGGEANKNSNEPSMSADGRYTVFVSDASNLVPGDTNGRQDVFLYDRITASLTRINLGPGGVQANNNSITPKISANGRYVVFASDASNLVAGDTNGRRDIFVVDLATGMLTRENLAFDASQATNNTNAPMLSADGARLTFASEAENLIVGDTNGRQDIFLVTRDVVVDEVFKNGFE